MVIQSLHLTGILAIAAATMIASSILVASLSGKLGSRLLLYGHVGVILSWILFTYSFLVQDYSLYPVYRSSSSGLPWYYKLASSWANGSGSLLLLASVSSILYVLYHRSHKWPVKYSTTIVTMIGLILAYINKAFNKTPGGALEGLGLNPLLKSFWVYPHPIATFIAYAIILTASFAALWRWMDKRLIYLGWSTLTLALLLGGLWSYETLGWGGYWAWDPVETAQIIPWLFLTAYFHSRGLSANAGNAALLLSGMSVLFAVYVTRAGVSPLHGFSDPAAQTGLVVAVPLVILASSAISSLYKAGGGTPKTIRGLSVFISYVTLMYMASALLASLATGVIGVALGFNVAPLSWDPAVSLYTPMLAPGVVLILVGLIMYFAATLGRLKLSLLVLATITVSLILSLLTLREIIVWSPLSPLYINILISILIPMSLVSGSLALFQLYKLKARLAGHSIIHLGLSILIIGIALSGPYAYNQGYFKEVELTEGTRVNLYGKNIILKSIEYNVSRNTYVNASGYYNSIVYLNALNAMDYAYKLFDNYPVKLERALEKAEALKINVLIDGITQVNFMLTTRSCETSGIGVAKLILNPRLDGLGSNYIIALNGTLNDSCTAGLYEEGSLKVTYEVEYTLEIYEFKAVISDNRILAVSNSTATLYYSNGSVLLDEEFSSPEWYWYALYKSNPLFKELVDENRRLEENNLRLSLVLSSALKDSDCISLSTLDLTRCNLRAILPDKLPETAYMRLGFIVDGEEKYVVLRYDVQGELQGIRGLVPKALIIRDGLSDVYMEVYPEVINLTDDLFVTKLTQYYLSQIFSSIDESDAVALSFVIASSLLSEASRSAGVNLEPLNVTLVALRILSIGLEDVGDSTIIVRAKVVENIQLVWVGGLLMVLGGLISLTTSSRRRV
ncbi:MAG: cytochrome c biogenesis protein CcsA [Desulfurococcales archaeon]|nr:cytochrome c biogenesis protein CcsA [Desulfurococcales archaeon]